MNCNEKRVQFRAPHRLIDRADVLVEVLGEDRTDILVTALREYLQETTHDDTLTQEIAAAYYDEITFEQLKTLVGIEEAANLRVLKQQLDEDFVDEVAEELAAIHTLATLADAPAEIRRQRRLEPSTAVTDEETRRE